jgi:hypothetical protein
MADSKLWFLRLVEETARPAGAAGTAHAAAEAVAPATQGAPPRREGGAARRSIVYDPGSASYAADGNGPQEFDP